MTFTLKGSKDVWNNSTDKLQAIEEGIKKSQNFADVSCEWCLGGTFVGKMA